MQPTYQLSLPGLWSLIRVRKRFIVASVLLAAVAGFTAALLRPKKYEAKAEFFLRNPLYADRNFLYNTDSRYIDYFAGDADVNRLMVIAHADDIQLQLIREFGLLAAYKVDSTDYQDFSAFRKDFGTRLNIWRSDNRSVELSYVDKDARRAALLANRAVSLIEAGLQAFYNETRSGLHASVRARIREQDSAILTDTLVGLRERYGIYDIISPARNNIMLSSNARGSERPGYARGLEEVQNLESVKDELVTVRAHNTALAEQYATGSDLLPFIHVTQAARPPSSAAGPGKLATAVICGAVALLFSVLWVLVFPVRTRADQ